MVNRVIEEDMRISLMAIALVIREGKFMGNSIFNYVEKVKQGINVRCHCRINSDRVVSAVAINHKNGFQQSLH